MKQQGARETQQEILRAAKACFAERGFRGTSMREVARRAGVTQPLIHHYFGSKDELSRAVLRVALEEYDQFQFAQWQRAPDDPAFLTTGLRVLFDWMGSNREILLLGMWARIEGGNESSEMDELVSRVDQHLRGARQAGLLRADLDVEIVLILLDTMIKGFWERREEFLRYPLDTTRLESRFFEQMMKMIIDAFFTPEAKARALALFQGHGAESTSAAGAPGEPCSA